MSSSCAAETVTSRAVFQSIVVNVSAFWLPAFPVSVSKLRSASPPVLLLTVTVTFAVGCLPVSFTV